MRGSEFLDKLERMDPALIQEAARDPAELMDTQKKPARLRLFGRRGSSRQEAEVEMEEMPVRQPRRFGFGGLVAAAMCLGAVLLPVILTSNAGRMEPGSQSVTASAYAQFQDWHEGFAPEDYFAFNDPDTQGKVGIYRVDGVAERALSAWEFNVVHLDDPNERSFSRHMREIPGGGPFPENCHVQAMVTFGGGVYGEKGQEARIHYQLYDPNDDAYTVNSLYVILDAEQQPWEKFEEYLESSQCETVTYRDGVAIRAVGQEGFEKALWFYRNGAWVKLYGDENTSAAELATLLDYMWNENLDVTRLNIDDGDRYNVENLSELPEDLAAYIPVDNQWCPGEFQGIYATFRNGVATCASCDYVEDPDKFITSWTVDDGIEYPVGEYVEEMCIGDLDSLTQQQVEDYIKVNDRSRKFQGLITFTWDGQYISAGYLATGNTAADMWEFLCYVRDEMGASYETIRQEWHEGIAPADYFQHSGSELVKPLISSTNPALLEESVKHYHAEWPDGYAQAGINIPLPGDVVSIEGVFSPDGALEKVIFLSDLDIKSEHGESHYGVYLACGPGKGDFSQGDESFQGRTITVRDGVEIQAVGPVDDAAGMTEIYFQTADGWYEIVGMGSRDWDISNLGTIAEYLFENPLDFDFFQKAEGYTYVRREISAEEIPEALSGLTFLHGGEASTHHPAVTGVQVWSRSDVEDGGTTAAVITMAADEPEKLVQGAEIFTDSDLRRLQDYQRAHIMDPERVADIPMDQVEKRVQEAYMDYINTYHEILFDWEQYHVSLKVKENATAREVWEFMRTMVDEAAFAERMAEESARANQDLWQRAKDLLYGSGWMEEAPLGELMLHSSPGGASYDPAEDPCAGRLGYLEQQDIETFLARDDLKSMYYGHDYNSDDTIDAGEEYQLFAFDWNGLYATAPIMNDATPVDVIEFITIVQIMANEDTLGVTFPMVDWEDGQSQLLGGESAWQEPVLKAVEQWEKKYFGSYESKIAEYGLKSLRLTEATKDGTGALINVRLTFKPEDLSQQWIVGNTWYYQDQGWYTCSQMLVLSKEADGWQVLNAGYDPGNAYNGLEETLAELRAAKSMTEAAAKQRTGS